MIVRVSGFPSLRVVSADREEGHFTLFLRRRGGGTNPLVNVKPGFLNYLQIYVTLYTQACVRVALCCDSVCLFSV